MAAPDATTTERLQLEPLMSIDEVAAVLRISERGVYRLIRGGELLSLKVGHRTLLEPAEVRAFIGRHRQSCPPSDRSNLYEQEDRSPSQRRP